MSNQQSRCDPTNPAQKTGPIWICR